MSHRWTLPNAPSYHLCVMFHFARFRRRREMLDTMFAGKSSDDTAEEFHPERFLLEKLHSASAADLKLFLQFLELSEGALDEETLNKLVEVVDALCILNTQIEDKVAEDEWPVSKGLEGKVRESRHPCSC